MHWLISTGIWSAIVLLAVLSGTLCFYSALAIWAGLSQRHWFVRAFAIVATLPLLLPVRAFEAVLFFAIFATFVVAVARCCRQKKTGSNQARSEMQGRLSPRRRVRYGMSDLLLVMILVGITTATATFVARHGPLFGWWQIALTAVASAAATLAAAWFVFGSKYLPWRVAAMIVSILVASASWIIGDWAGVEVWVFMGWEKCFVFLPCYLLLVVYFMLWFGCTSPVNWPASPRARPVKRWGRWIARVGMGLVSLAVLSCGCWMYARLARPLPAKVAVTANPNGFEDIVAVGAALQNSQIPDLESVSPAAIETFVKQHPSNLSRVRSGLGKPCQVPLVYKPPTIGIRHLQQVMNVSRLLRAESLWSKEQGRFEEAALTGVDCVQLAAKGSAGGLSYDSVVADRIQNDGTACIANVRRDLDSTACRDLIARLESAIRQREPLEAFFQRDDDYDRIAYGWRWDLWRAVIGLTDPERTGHAHCRSSRKDAERKVQQLLAELAIGAYRLDHGEYPAELGLLSPAYLSSVPHDPYGHGPVCYRRDGEGYLLYSVGPNGIDDGGKPLSLATASDNGQGDLFLDDSLD